MDTSRGHGVIPIARAVTCWIGLAALTGIAAAGPAVRLEVGFPCCPSPSPCTATTTDVGRRTCVGFAAVDSNGMFDTTYAGTVVFTSSDPAATLPGPCTFSPSDETCRFNSDVVFRTSGVQTLTLSDASGVLQPGSATILVLPVGPIPAVGWRAKFVLISLLALVGALFVRRV